MRLLKRKEQQALDRYFIDKGVPILLLMEAAGASLARIIAHSDAALAKDRPVDLLIGPGMNGGDLYASGRHLLAKGYTLRVWESERNREGLKDPTLTMRQALLGLGVRPALLADYVEDSEALIVDGLLGAGFDPLRPLSDEIREALEKMQKAKDGGAYIFSCDLPSGISTDLGQVSPYTVRADETVTFFAPKAGMMSSPGKDYCGKIYISDLDLPASSVSAFWEVWDKEHQVSDRTEPFGRGLYSLDFSEWQAKLGSLSAQSHKWQQGKLVVVAGQKGMAGAAYLALAGAAHSGVGLIHSVCHEAIYPELFLGHPSVIYGRVEGAPEDSKAWLRALETRLPKASALLIGPGLGLDEKTEKLLSYVLSLHDLPLVLDADALTVLAASANLQKAFHQRQKEGGQTLLTPHEGEAKRLALASENSSSDSEKLEQQWQAFTRMEKASYLCQKYQADFILKGPSSIIVSYEGHMAYLNPTGGPALAQGGTGDILAGLAAGLLAQGFSPLDAGALAAFWHGRAGDLASEEKGPRASTIQDILAKL